jgi:NAD(P)-dependent dehydrogenase (short-subunit alcohol dehydrogenase family)
MGNKLNNSGKVAVVTGASSGIGIHFAKLMATTGAQVIVMARRFDRLERLVEDIESAGGQARAIKVDVSDAAQVRRAFESIERVDIIVNNAGVAGRSSSLDCSESEWRWTFDVNVHGVWFVAQQAALKMIAAKSGGTIVNIASITGVRPGVSATAYSTSKAAVIQMTRSLATEWARHNIRVNAIAPGYFETDLNREFLHSDYGQRMTKRIPQRRFGRLEELDGTLLLLTSEASSFITGAIIEVDGGHLVSPL